MIFVGTLREPADNSLARRTAESVVKLPWISPLLLIAPSMIGASMSLRSKKIGKNWPMFLLVQSKNFFEPAPVSVKWTAGCPALSVPAVALDMSAPVITGGPDAL